MATPRKKRQAKLNHFTYHYTRLECKNMLSGISIENIIGLQTLLIDGSSSADVAEVQIASNGQVEATLNGQSEQFSRDDFERIRFLGRSGNDSFTNRTDIDSAAFGHNGNDELIGGSGHNWIQGGNGDDHIVGGDRNDQLRGRSGNDFIDGGKRHDRIFGGGGIDTILGGAGHDFIRGEAGSDHIFGGNGNDRIGGGTGDNRLEFGNTAGADIAILEFNESDATISVANPLLSISNTHSSNEIVGGDIARFSDVDRAIEDYFVVLNEVEERSLEALYQFRSSRGLGPLQLRADLANYAASRAQQELVPLGINPTVQELNDAHSTFEDVEHLFTNGRTLYLENISYLAPQNIGPETAANLIHDSFVNSPSHFANMTNPTVDEFGISIVRNSNGWYVIHNFFG